MHRRTNTSDKEGMPSGINSVTGKNDKFKDLTGMIFGRLTVLRRTENRVAPCGIARVMYLCRCVCGREKNIASGTLKAGTSKSCGCLRAEIVKIANSLAPFQALYHKFLELAGRMGRNVEISFEDFLEYTKTSKCHYCSGEITWSPYKRDGEKFGYNLDRKDSNKGYSKDNCVVCCARCNQSKSNTFSYDEWAEIGRTIERYRTSRGN